MPTHVHDEAIDLRKRHFEAERGLNSAMMVAGMFVPSETLFLIENALARYREPGSLTSVETLEAFMQDLHRAMYRFQDLARADLANG